MLTVSDDLANKVCPVAQLDGISAGNLPDAARGGWSICERSYPGLSYVRTCNYCGCVHPHDVTRLLDEEKAIIEGTNKAYKLYCAIVNPNSEESALVSYSGFKHHPDAVYVDKENLREYPAVRAFVANEIRTENKGFWMVFGKAQDRYQLKLYSLHFDDYQWADLKSVAR